MLEKNLKIKKIAKTRADCREGLQTSAHQRWQSYIVSHVKWQQKFNQYLATDCISMSIQYISIFIRPHSVLVTHKDSNLGQIGLSMKTALFLQNKTQAKQNSSQNTRTEFITVHPRYYYSLILIGL